VHILYLFSLFLNVGLAYGATPFFAEGAFTQNGIEWCEENYQLYQIMQEEFFVHHKHSIESRVCVSLFGDPLWTYDGADRYEKLIERSAYYVQLEIEESKVEAETGKIDITPATEPTEEIWESLAPMPTPRTEVMAIPVGERIYVIGGFDKDGRGTNTVEVFDTINNSWKAVSPIPEELHHVGATAHNEEIYIVGGYKNGWQPSDLLFIYNTVTDTWNVGPPMPTARGALTAQFIGNTLYAVGGGDRIALSVNEAFDTKTNSWQTKASMPTARDHLTSAVVGEKMFVIGGRVMSMALNLGTNEVYDPQTNSWEILEEMPTPRGGLTSSSINGTIFVFGGEEPSGTFDQNEQFIPGQGWQTHTTMPTARHGLGSATVNDRIYVIGGGIEPGLSVSGLNESYYNSHYIPEFGILTMLVLTSGISIGIYLLKNKNLIYI